MIEGVLFGHKAAAGSLLMDKVQGQIFFIDRYAFKKIFEVVDDLVGHDDAFPTGGVARLHVTDVMDQVAAHQGGLNEGHGVVDGRVLIECFGVGAAARVKVGQIVEIGQFLEGDVVQAELWTSV